MVKGFPIYIPQIFFLLLHLLVHGEKRICCKAYKIGSTSVYMIFDKLGHYQAYQQIEQVYTLSRDQVTNTEINWREVYSLLHS